MTTQQSLSVVTVGDRSADRRNRPGPCTCSTGIGRALPERDFADRRAVRGLSGNPATPHNHRRNSRSSTSSNPKGSCPRGRNPARGRYSAGSTRDAADSSRCRRNYRIRSDRRPRVTGRVRPQGPSHSRQTTGKPDRSRGQRAIFDSWFAVPPKFRCCARERAKTGSIAGRPGVVIGQMTVAT